jgi:hypothetical protein
MASTAITLFGEEPFFFRSFRNRILTQSAAIALATVIGWGSIAASEFNSASRFYAHEQEAKWKAIDIAAACNSAIPSAYLKTVLAPRLWNYSTASMSWGDATQAERYWDLYVLVHYGIRAHFTKTLDSKTQLFTALDYRIDGDGNMEGVVLARTADGQHFHEVLVIKRPQRETTAGILERNVVWEFESPQNTTTCRDGLQVVRFTGQDLNIGSAQLHGLPIWNPSHGH